MESPLSGWSFVLAGSCFQAWSSVNSGAVLSAVAVWRMLCSLVAYGLVTVVLQVVSEHHGD